MPHSLVTALKFPFAGVFFIAYIPFFWSQLMAMGHPRLVPFVGLMFLGAAYLSFRWSRRASPYIEKGFSILCLILTLEMAVAQFLMPFVTSAWKDWKDWFGHGCGISVGMTEKEVISAIKTHATLQSEKPSDGRFYLYPSGFAALEPLEIDINEVAVSTDSAGRVAFVRATRFF